MNEEQLTDEEVELIKAIRAYQHSKHNPSKELKRYAKRLFEKMLD